MIVGLSLFKRESYIRVVFPPLEKGGRGDLKENLIKKSPLTLPTGRQALFVKEGNQVATLQHFLML